MNFQFNLLAEVTKKFIAVFQGMIGDAITLMD